MTATATRGAGQGLLHHGVVEDVHELPPFQSAAAVLQSRPWRRKRSRCLGYYIAGRSETGKQTRNSKSGLYYWPFSRPSSSNFMTCLRWWTSNHFTILRSSDQTTRGLFPIHGSESASSKRRRMLSSSCRSCRCKRRSWAPQRFSRMPLKSPCGIYAW